jgi:hypothetical protein
MNYPGNLPKSKVTLNFNVMIHASRKITSRQSCLILGQQTQLLKFLAYLEVFRTSASLSQKPLKTVVYGRQN